MQKDIYTPTGRITPQDEIERVHKNYQLALKDLTLSRLELSEVAIVRLWNVIIDAQRNQGYYDAAYMDEHEFLIWLAAKRAIGGEERKAANTVNQNVTADYGSNPPTVVNLGNAQAGNKQL